MTVLSVQLVASTLVILLGANQLTRWADIIAERTGLGRSFVGLLLLATATSLPELGTGVSAIVYVHNADLAMGAAFGSNLFNLAIICLLDVVWRRGPILGAVSEASTLVAGLGIMAIGVCSIAVLLPQWTLFDGLPVGPISLIVLGVFVWAMRTLYTHERGVAPKSVVEKRTRRGTDATLVRAFAWYALSALVVIVGSIWLARTGGEFVQQTGLEASFVGTQFLALCTSLPEVATSLAALRIGAPDLALTNVLGSNLFNMGFVVFANDVAFWHGSIWSHVEQIHAFTGGVAMVMTSIVLFSLVKRQHTSGAKHARTGRLEFLSLLALYVIASYVVYEAG